MLLSKLALLVVAALCSLGVQAQQAQQVGCADLEVAGNTLTWGSATEAVRSMSLYDAAGRRVAHVNGNGQPGQIVLTTAGLPNGVYVARIVSETQHLTQKVVVENGIVRVAVDLASDESSAVAEAPAAPRVAPFPVADDAKALTGTNVVQLMNLIKKMDNSRALSMGETNITDEQFAELKAFVDDELVGSNDAATVNNIFDWIRANIKVAGANETAYLDPYDVFTHKKCVCQGYTNLFKAMVLTQNIPCFGVNGYLGTQGAHAWNYVYNGKIWLVRCATNGMKFNMTRTSEYADRLIPWRAEMNMFEDDGFFYGYENQHFSVNEVKEGAADELTVPYSAEGYILTQFFPRKPIPANVRSISLGKNIESVGLYPNMLNDVMPNVEEIHVDPENKVLESYKNVLYCKNPSLYEVPQYYPKPNTNVPLYIPYGIKVLEIKPIEVMDKNHIYDLPYVEEIYIPDGVKTVCAWAIENCPRLKRVYVSKTVTNWDENAIASCPEDVEIIWMETGITDVRM